MSKLRRLRQEQRRNSPVTPIDALKELGVAAAPPCDKTKEIRLMNPVSQHYGAFIFGNAQKCDRVVEQGTAKGQTLVLCGAGPSLVESAEEYCRGADQLWGCNSALPWLVKHEYPVTHAITVDQTPDMCKEWITAPDVEYLVASTVHPFLVEYLMAKDRQLRFFHNYVGIRKPPVEWVDKDDVKHTMNYEHWMYSVLYTPTLCCGSGLNSVTRALDVALYMGFEKITILGADCALRVKSRPPKVDPRSAQYQRWLREDTVMHADGGNAIASGATATTMGGEIDGRYWETKPDLMISAKWLMQLEKHHAGRVVLVGDTLPAALRGQSEEFLSRLPTMVDSSGTPIVIPFE